MRLPMSPLDAMFLVGESRRHPLHVGAVQLFTPPDGADAHDIRVLLTDAARDPNQVLAPALSRSPYRSPRTWGQWAWRSDDADPDDHVRAEALPGPGTRRQLFELCAWLHSAPLDRTRPLWEMHLIEGLADGRLAVYTKLHHAVADGVGAMRMLRGALSEDPDDRAVPAPWQARPARRRTPTQTQAHFDVVHAARAGFAELAGMVPALASTLGRSIRESGSAVSFSAPQTMFNVSIGSARRFTARSWPLERLRLVAKASGTTVNDVVLAMSSGALRRYLLTRGALPDRPLVAMVPVSLRSQIAGDGNAIGVLMCNLATHSDDAQTRLTTIADCMRDGKDALSHMSPTQVLAMSALGAAPVGASMLFGHNTVVRPPFNLIVSNVTGSDVPLYWNGARLDALYPMSVPVDGQALNITCTSHDDELFFGVTACRRAVPDLPSVIGHFDTELSALERAAGV
ncbi:wax ester/triacylglycerol synthase family O-acyltransferase [Rhodococcus sp. HNM0569]|uniref:WS/DGAT/MGAT family O-acyltransferase n=1 Tax=Rhodococcus sp. HNM0569 TaxID=2716340 RepID=UPI00146B5796|nr:wax ester/triacylglycerol synthase family O-acyltransferase [Rhodococcus sp. HNM0569]NLU84818.1 wax ester/triacylglycerol synthase family O-acyltransferase [Rhodococcus sp. HNM0569]